MTILLLEIFDDYRNVKIEIRNIFRIVTLPIFNLRNPEARIMTSRNISRSNRNALIIGCTAVVFIA